MEDTRSPILSELSDRRVFDVSVKDGLACFGERCDDYFEVLLNKDQVIQLAEELLAFARKYL